MNSYIKSRTFFESKNSDKKVKKHPIIICWKLNTPHNLGAILRIADNMACEKVIFVDDNPSFKERNIKKIAQTSYNAIEWHFCTSDNWKAHIPNDYICIAIETSKEAKNTYQVNLDRKIAFVVGNEKVGIDESTIDICEEVIYIPMMGHNKSMNVSHAATIVLGEWLRQNYYCNDV